ncbi:MAG: UDP-3-O-acyl-N-acetylglucosamine deacetylase [Paracoccaceae bacterium]
MQTSISTPVSFRGFGLHGGQPACVMLRPAPADYGVRFRRTDLDSGPVTIPARWDLVQQSPLCTRIEAPCGASVSTIEHLMAALAGCGVHNVHIDIDGPEVPILDGSAVRFVRGLLQAGVSALDVPLDVIEVLQPVTFRTRDGWAKLTPKQTFSMGFHISFPDQAIGTQAKQLNLANGSFVRELSDSRTFCRQADVDAMQSMGLALGGVPGENAVVFDGDAVVSPGGLRHRDEPVRHKMLDALGDLALAGAPILGHYEGHRAGHAITNSLLRTLFDTPGAWQFRPCTAGLGLRLPGAGVARHEIPRVA